MHDARDTTESSPVESRSGMPPRATPEMLKHRAGVLRATAGCWKDEADRISAALEELFNRPESFERFESGAS